MNQIWIIVIALIALLLVTRIRARRRTTLTRRAPAAGPRIQGRRVCTVLHPRMSAACLFDHGLQFGKGFRRKEGPRLPHDAECRCTVLPFAFTSSEVFNGALRSLGAVKSTIDGLQPADAQRLLDRLKAAEAPLPPGQAGAYLAAVGVEAFPAAIQDALRAFLAERHAYLLRTPHESASGAAADPTERLASSDPT